MYGNVDVALRFLEKYSGILMTNLGFIQSQTDPCIFFKHDKVGKLSIVISTYVDKSITGVRKWKVEEFFKQLVEYLKIKMLGQLNKHLEVWWEWKEDHSTGEIYLRVTRLEMVQEIKEAYAKVMGKPAKLAKTLGYLGKF